MKVDKDKIALEVGKITGGKRTNMKAVLEAIETLFPDIALVCVDKKKDTVLFGFQYLDEQEALNSCDEGDSPLH